MVKLITAEEAKILNEMRENLNKIYRTLNKTIREDALDGKNEIDYSLSPYLFKNHEILIGILRDSLIEAGYHVEITNKKSLINVHSIDETTLNISWSKAANTEAKDESETEK